MADRRIDSGKMPRRANERFSLVNCRFQLTTRITKLLLSIENISNSAKSLPVTNEFIAINESCA